MHLRHPNTLIAASILALLSGCATHQPAKSTDLEVLRIDSKTVYDAKKPVEKPALQVPIRTEELFGYNNGPQPMLYAPQGMIIGDTGGVDPDNPNVMNFPSQQYVVIEDWRFNEEAIRGGADIRIPGNRNPGIEELRILPPSPQSTELADPDTRPIPNLNGGGNGLIGTEEKPAPTSAPGSIVDTLDMPIASNKPGELFLSFLAEEGEKYPQLRKNFRKLGLPTRSQYDTAMKHKTKTERVGYHPEHGWLAFQIKAWTDLSNKDLAAWLESKEFKTYMAAHHTDDEANASVEPADGRTSEDSAILSPIAAASRSKPAKKSKEILVDIE